MGTKLAGTHRNSAGDAIASGTISAFRAGTETLASIYSDVTLSLAQANPFTGGADGRFRMFVPPGGPYKLRAEKDGVIDWEEDYLVAPSLPLAYDIRDYGAKVDGTTDDTTAVQRAVTAAGDAGGGAVFIPHGQTNISATIVMRDNVMIFGAGYASRVHMTVADTQMFLCQSVDKCAFHNFRLTGQGGFTTPGLGAIRLGLGSAGNGSLDSWVANCWLEGVSNCGVTIGSKSERCRVINCLIDDAGEEGVYLLGKDCIVTGNTLINNGNAGIKVSGATETHPIITGNFCSYNGNQGILLTGTTTGGVTNGNTCAYNVLEGIRVAENMADHAIVGNHCIGNSSLNDNVHANIEINGAGVARIFVDANMCRKGSGANRPKYGLEIVSATDTILGNNDLRNSGQTGQYSNAGTNTQAVMLAPREQAATGNTAVTTTSDVDVTGCSISVTPLLDQRIMVHAVVDTTRGVAGATLLVSLNVNGVNQSAAMVLTDSGRQMIAGVWVVSLTGGTAYTIKLVAKLTVGAGPDFTITSGSTKIALAGASQP